MIRDRQHQITLYKQRAFSSKEQLEQESDPWKKVTVTSRHIITFIHYFFLAARAESTKHIKIENGENKQNINVNPNYKRTLLELKEELEKIKQQMIELEHDVENENNE